MKYSLQLQDSARSTNDIREADASDLTLLRSLHHLFGERRYTVHENTIQVTADWEKYSGATGWPRQIGVTVAITGVSSSQAGDVLQFYLTELFILSNIASPGLFGNFRMNAVIGDVGLELPAVAEMDSYIFDRAWHEAQAGVAPSVKSIPLGNVVAWYDALGMGTKQFAETPAQKALFCLMHTARLAAIVEPTATFWLARALEALYHVPTALSFSFLADRVAALFELEPRDAAALRKRLRQFFDTRNGLVHGGAPVLHPVNSEVLDSKVDDRREESLTSIYIGVHIVLATIQEMVIRGYRDLQFREIVDAVAL